MSARSNVPGAKECPSCGSTDVTLIGQQYLVCDPYQHRWTRAITVNRD
ncbi:MAG: hypothetical protein J6O18_07170 [Bacilli bacterium]|nr:hypothetical protein [Bacilli bacterium]